MARIAIVGLGPIGLATGIAFALKGHVVIGADADPMRRDAIGRGRGPFFDASLEAGRAGFSRRDGRTRLR